MPTLSATIQTLTAAFADGVVQAIRACSLEDISSDTKGAPRRGPGRPPGRRNARPTPTSANEVARRGPGRRPGASRERRSSAELAKMSNMIVAYIKSHPGLTTEKIKAALGIARKHWPRPLAMALASSRITKKGEKRATR